MGRARVAQHVGQARRPDPARRPGARAGPSATRSSDRESLRWTMTSRSRPIRSSKAATSVVDRRGVPTSMPAPQACAVSRQKPTRSAGTPRRGDRRAAIARQLVDVVPSPPPLPAEFSRTSMAGRGRVGRRVVGRARRRSTRRRRRDRRRVGRERARMPPRAARCPPRRRAQVRADVDVDEPCPERRARCGARGPACRSSARRTPDSTRRGSRGTRAWIATGRDVVRRGAARGRRPARAAARRGAARPSGCR